MSAISASYGVARAYGLLDTHREFQFATAGTARHDLLSGTAHAVAIEEEQSGLPGAPLMWLGDVYSLVDRRDPDGAIDVLFAHVDDLLSAGDFAGCDALLATMDPKRLDANLLVATLSVTKRASDRLSERPAFVRRATARLRELAPDRTERLLSGLV